MADRRPERRNFVTMQVFQTSIVPGHPRAIHARTRMHCPLSIWVQGYHRTHSIRPGLKGCHSPIRATVSEEVRQSPR